MLVESLAASLAPRLDRRLVAPSSDRHLFDKMADPADPSLGKDELFVMDLLALLLPIIEN